MKTTYRTSSSFFVSPVGRRLQEQVRLSLADEKLKDVPAVLIGPVFPFLAAFDQNNPDFVEEKETLSGNDLLSPWLSTRNVNIVFIVALNDSVTENLSVLIKEAARTLKQHGQLIILIKNKQKAGLLNIREMPETPLSVFGSELKTGGFSVQRKKGILHFPYTLNIFKAADDFLFKRFDGGGYFSLIIARKDPFVFSNAENYSSTRMTNASVLTSPRT